MNAKVLLIPLVITLGATGWLPAEGLDGPTNPEVVTKTAAKSEKSGTPKNFGGFYAGLDVGPQEIFGTATVDNVPVLAQDTRKVVSFALGWRKEFENRLVLGVEGRVGLVDGDLEVFRIENQLSIRHRNGSQTGYRLSVGRVLGEQRRVLVSAYYGESERTFDVLIQAALGPFNQHDDQTFEHLGVGAEWHLAKRWNLRGTVGRSEVDFGGPVTSLATDEDLAFGLGLTYQFRRRK